MDALSVLWGPGLVFIAIAIWLVRKVIKAARTERDLEEARLAAALGPELLALKARAEAAGHRGTAADGRESGQGQPGAGIAKPHLVPTQAEPAMPPAVAAQARGANTFRRSLAAADVAGCSAEHLAVIGALLDERERLGYAGPTEVLWARTVGAYATWCERRHPAPPATLVRDVLQVTLVREGKVGQRWSYGGDGERP